MKLSDEQAKIIEVSREGKHAVFAGPGSGKTALLIARVKEISRDREALCITFTRNAAREMAERADAPAEFRTLDSLAYRFWRDNAWRYAIDTHGWRVLSNRERLHLAREVCRDLMPRKYSPSDLLKISSAYKRLDKFPFPPQYDLKELFEFEHELGLTDEELLSLFYEYERRKRERKLIEFEDFELFMKECLESGDAIFRAEDLSVDEAHDLSFLQWRLLDLIDAPHLFVVASPEQSIYGFRQARPDFLQEFVKRKSLRIHRLENNFRSARKIVSLANAVFDISRPMRETEGLVKYLGHFDSQLKEAESIMQLIDARPTGILVRCNMQTIPFVVEALNRKRAYKTAQALFNRVSVRLLLDWLKVGVRDDADAHRELVELMELRPSAITKSAMDAVSLGDAKLAISYIRKTLGLDTHIAVNAYEDEDYEDEMWLLDVIETFAAGKSPSEFLNWVDEMESLRRDDANLWIGTIHSAKGLEWDVVFVAGVTEGILPHSRGDKEEELRLFYVAITRARDELYLSSCRIRRYTEPSRYLAFLEVMEDGKIS